MTTTCASRCAPRSMPTTSSPSTTSSATITTSAPTTSSRSSTSNSANDGFHEAIGDFIALSVTPEYLVQIGLLDRAQGAVGRQGHRPAAPPGDGQGRLPAVRPAGRQMALGGVQRRDHAGQLQPGAGSTCACSIRASPRRSRAASRISTRAPSIHIPGNTPYTRYFLARILQFQFYKAACEQAGWTGPAPPLLASTATRRSARG